MKQTMLKRIAAAFLAAASLAALTLSLSGCSSRAKEQSDKSDIVTMEAYDGGYSDYYYTGEYGVNSTAAPTSYSKTAEYSEESRADVKDTRKIIRTMTLDLETKEFDAGVEQIRTKAEQIGGYVESSYVSGKNLYNGLSQARRNASFVLRVPSERLDAFASELGGSFNIVSRREDSDDITDTYYDTAARLKSLETQEERLLSMLEGATELEYMLQLEDKLSEVRYQIESYYSTISRYDKQVAYSTLNISLSEVIEYQPPVTVPKTFGERIGTAFRNSWKDFAEGFKDFTVEFIYSFPGLLLFAIIVFVIVIIIRAIVRRRRRRKAEKASAPIAK